MPPLPTAAIERFLAQPRNDCRPYKRLDGKARRKARDALPVRPPIWGKLRRHQRVGVLLGALQHRFAFWLDTGCGKTLLSVALVRYFRKLGTVRRVLVLVPKKVNKGEWRREVAKHSPTTRVMILSGSSAHKWSQLAIVEESKPAIILETYAGLIRMLCDLQKNKRGQNKLKPSRAKLRDLLEVIDGLILDESHKAKTKAKLPYRLCRAISKAQSTKIVFALSGTPFGRDPTDLWAQMHIVDGGETLGPTLTLFRSAFFTETEDEWGRRHYTFQQKKSKLLHQLLAHKSIRYTARQADLPRLIPIRKAMKLPADIATYVERARETLKTSGDYRELKNAFLRMRQLSSGFVGYKDDDTGSRAELEFPENPKLEMCLGLVESIRDECKTIIFHEYNFSGDMLSRELKKLNIGHVRVWGKLKDDPNEVLRRFDQDPNVRVLLLSNSCAEGLNLQVAQYGIVFESPVSPITRKQALARFHRQESPHDRVFLYDLVMTGTFDDRILTMLANGRDLFREIVEGRGPSPAKSKPRTAKGTNLFDKSRRR